VTFFFAIAGGALCACNAISGQHDRFLDTEDDEGGPGRRDGSGGGEDVVSVDGGVDAPLDQSPFDSSNDSGPIVIEVDVGGAWRSPNGASFATVDGGKRIDAYDAGATHPVIIPVTQPSGITSDDYTVTATILAASTGSPGPAYEWGILTRVQTGGDGLLVSSAYGAQARAFVGVMPSTDWNPQLAAIESGVYTYMAGQRYRMKLKVVGPELRGKLWLATDPEPAGEVIWGQATLTTGRGVGFYTYGINDAILEKMTITIP